MRSLKRPLVMTEELFIQFLRTITELALDAGLSKARIEELLYDEVFYLGSDLDQIED